MNFTKKIILKVRFNIWAKLKANFYPSFYLSHSQFGEDMVINFLTNGSFQGFYVDIGAHHPVYISNTYHFYCKGWRGINVDAIPGSMDIFKVLRPRDINLELCLSPLESEEVEFFTFDRPAFNTCNHQVAEKVLSSGQANLVEKYKLQAITLKECLEQYLPAGTEIDLMSIDIEGMDEAILMSNDWNRYRPKILVFEKHLTPIQELNQLPIIKYLASFDYKIVARCGPSVILERQLSGN